MSGRVVFAVMAKAPRPGEVKTRLCPPLSPDDAATLARCFLADKVAQVRAVAGADVTVAFTPEADRPLFEALAPGIRLLPQRGEDLGARMRATLEDALADGYTAALVLGTDTPSLPVEVLREAAALVMRPEIDLVLGPSEDGGYYLIGMRRVWPALFSGVPWSTADVLAETRRRAAAHGLRVALLPRWFDVDTPDDLRRLIASSPAQPAGSWDHTRHFLEGAGLRRGVRDE